MSAPRQESHASRREFIRRVAYTAPVLLTLPASPALAQVGSATCDTSSPFIDNCDPPPDDS